MAKIWRGVRRKFRTQPAAVDVRTGYARWADAYPPRPHNVLMEVEQQAILALLREVRGLTCLDLACGSGRYLQWMRAEGARAAVGLDLSPEMLARAAEESAGTLAVGAMAALPFPSAVFDVIVCGLAVGHLPDLQPALNEAARTLRPGGVLVYSDLHPQGAGAGWQRTFTAADGQVYALEHYIHRLSDHRRACRGAGLTIVALAEPAAPTALPAHSGDAPLALVIRAEKARTSTATL